jgi:hypothetical protein
MNPDEMTSRLERLADVRRPVVARGRELIADANYPDKKTIRSVARLLARHWSR